MTVIQKCREDDFEQIFKLLEQLWPGKRLNEKKLSQVFMRGLESEPQCYICAKIDTDIIGFVSLTLKNSLWQFGLLGHIDELVVDKNHRGKGIGSELLEHIIQAAKEKGCRRIELDSAPDRNQAHKFYGKNCFENSAFLFSKNIG